MQEKRLELSEQHWSPETLLVFMNSRFLLRPWPPDWHLVHLALALVLVLALAQVRPRPFREQYPHDCASHTLDLFHSQRPPFTATHVPEEHPGAHSSAFNMSACPAHVYSWLQTDCRKGTVKCLKLPKKTKKNNLFLFGKCVHVNAGRLLPRCHSCFNALPQCAAEETA